MSSSRRRETRPEGVGREGESVKRMFPPALMKSRRIWGVNCGPSPIYYMSIPLFLPNIQPLTR